MCRGLSYNLTSFPNIWLSIADQREAATLLRQYRVKAAATTYIHYLDFLVASLRASKIGPLGSKKTPIMHEPLCRPGADGACVLRAPAEAGVWDVSASVQPSGWGPPALPLSLLLCRAAMQPSPGSLLFQLAFQLPPPARLAGSHGVLVALMFQEF